MNQSSPLPGFRKATHLRQRVVEKESRQEKAQAIMAETFHRNRSSKRRAPQGELRNLTTAAREKLHGWFRERKGEIPYHEIQKRLRKEFDIKVGFSTLSLYYSEKAREIWLEAEHERTAASASTAKTIVIRIEVPAGCAVVVSTEEQA